MVFKSQLHVALRGCIFANWGLMLFHFACIHCFGLSKLSKLIQISISFFVLLFIFQSNSYAEIKQQDNVKLLKQGWTIALENDVFSPQNSTDRWFTNGLHITTAFKEEEEPQFQKWTKNVIKPLLFRDDCDDKECDLTLVVSFGQNIYTPRKLNVAEPQLNDRPWAGWLYGGLGYSVFKGNRNETLSLKVGPIGPASFASDVQKFVHCCVVNSTGPKGWGNQLRPMIGAQISYLTTYRYSLTNHFDLQPSLGFTVGNTRNLARMGLGLNWAYDRGEGARLQPGSLDEGEFFVPDFSANPTNGTFLDALKHTAVYAHIQSSQVLYNVFIEGDAYDGKHNIDLIHNVITSTVGFTVPFGDKGEHKVGLAFKNRSPEFEITGENAGRDSYQTWGVLSYSRDFNF